MERLPNLRHLDSLIVTFAGYVIESQRPDESWDNELHPAYRSAFHNEQVAIQEMIDKLKSDISQIPQQSPTTKLLFWSNYADIFNSAYPLILHDPYTALLTLAIKVPSSFWKYFWFWMDSHEDTNFLHDELIGYLCYTVVPQLISEDVQRQACHEELEKLKPHEMTSTPMIMALQATGLSQQISPSLHDAIGLSQQIAPSLPW